MSVSDKKSLPPVADTLSICACTESMCLFVYIIYNVWIDKKAQHRKAGSPLVSNSVKKQKNDILLVKDVVLVETTGLEPVTSCV